MNSKEMAKMGGGKYAIVGLICLSVSTCFLATTSSAGIWPTDLNPANFGEISVVMADDASDGCWTNLGEVETYAADKLRSLGYTITNKPRSGSFSVMVNSERLDSGKCYGNVKIQIYRPTIDNGLFGYLEVADRGGIFTGYDNANSLVLDYVKKIADEMLGQSR
tara:strand:- start:3492 stop:3983 length:492 start_codon:yes stop_codon:yes gene_type:complete